MTKFDGHSTYVLTPLWVFVEEQFVSKQLLSDTSDIVQLVTSNNQMLAPCISPG